MGTGANFHARPVCNPHTGIFSPPSQKVILDIMKKVTEGYGQLSSQIGASETVESPQMKVFNNHITRVTGIVERFAFREHTNKLPRSCPPYSL